MDLELRDRAFLITGGTDGLGLALAQTLIDEGAFVAVCGRSEQRLAAARSILGERALCVSCDVTVPEQLESFVDHAITKFERLDGVVNNAGASSSGPIATSSSEAWRSDYELKVIPAVSVARLTLDALASAGGSILNILSITAKSPGANTTPTSASRAAGLALTKSLAGEVAPRNVRANAILIGLIESGQWDRAAAGADMAVNDLYATMAKNARIPLGRVGRASEFAALAAFVLSPKASYLTGAAINLDGGLSPVV
jgi:NAD(P)-dependent dehydrogenase (short-subunit alcohol dehydrogenase family)